MMSLSQGGSLFPTSTRKRMTPPFGSYDGSDATLENKLSLRQLYKIYPPLYWTQTGILNLLLMLVTSQSVWVGDFCLTVSGILRLQE